MNGKKAKKLRRMAEAQWKSENGNQIPDTRYKEIVLNRARAHNKTKVLAPGCLREYIKELKKVYKVMKENHL